MVYYIVYDIVYTSYYTISKVIRFRRQKFSTDVRYKESFGTPSKTTVLALFDIEGVVFDITKKPAMSYPSISSYPIPCTILGTPHKKTCPCYL